MKTIMLCFYYYSENLESSDCLKYGEDIEKHLGFSEIEVNKYDKTSLYTNIKCCDNGFRVV